MNPADLVQYVLGLGAAGGPLFFGLWWREQSRHEATRERLEAALVIAQEKRMENALAAHKIIEGSTGQMILLQKVVQDSASLLQQLVFRLGAARGEK